MAPHSVRADQRPRPRSAGGLEMDVGGVFRSEGVARARAVAPSTRLGDSESGRVERPRDGVSVCVCRVVSCH